MFDIHQKMDGAQETELSTGKLGTTGRGIGPTYCEKMNRTGVRACDLADFQLVETKYRRIVAHAVRLFPNLEEFSQEANIQKELKRY